MTDEICICGHSKEEHIDREPFLGGCSHLIDEKHYCKCPKFKPQTPKIEVKGCGKEFMYIPFLNDKRICGQIEDLKHSWNILLCPSCKNKETPKSHDNSNHRSPEVKLGNSVLRGSHSNTPDKRTKQETTNISSLIKNVEKGCGKSIFFPKDKRNVYHCGQYYFIFGKVLLCDVCQAKLQTLQKVEDLLNILKIEMRRDSRIIDKAEMVSVNCVFTLLDKYLGDKS